MRWEEHVAGMENERCMQDLDGETWGKDNTLKI